MKTKGLLAIATATTVAALGFTTAFASTTSTSFDSKYQSNLSMEQSLLTQAQSASSTNSTASALLATVQNINNQVSALYTAEQALASAKSSIPQVSATQNEDEKQLAELNHQRESILQQSNAEWKLVQEYEHHPKDKSLFNKALTKHNGLQKQLNSVNSQIASLKQKLEAWKDHPYDGGLGELQDSILRLQASAIHYTKEAIALEQSATTSSTGGSNTSSTSTSTNTGSTTTGSTSTDASSANGSSAS